jgi:hypothetical protein
MQQENPRRCGGCGHKAKKGARFKFCSNCGAEAFSNTAARERAGQRTMRSARTRGGKWRTWAEVRGEVEGDQRESVRRTWVDVEGEVRGEPGVPVRWRRIEKRIVKDGWTVIGVAAVQAAAMAVAKAAAVAVTKAAAAAAAVPAAAAGVMAAAAVAAVAVGLETHGLSW